VGETAAVSETVTRILQGRAGRAASIGWVAACADQALKTELMLTPKPGLVDQHNCGAHCDMDIATFRASVQTIAPWWLRFVEIGYACTDAPAGDFLGLVRPAGVGCEQAMLKATRGVNTHKGAIFALGLLCSAAGRLLSRNAGLNRECLCSEVARIGADLVPRELSNTQVANTAGERCFRLYGITGSRGEAASGYAAVRSVALPVYDRSRRDGASEDMALLQTLLHLMAINDDTNLVSRGGLAGLNFVREYSRKLLREGGVLAQDGLKRMEAFDAELVTRRLSPGGSADLLAVTWFLSRFPASDEESEESGASRK
jgi:triphosphoribosyl-dephospho-CoA synthase